MKYDCVTFEQPLNERMRTFLRVEHLFQQIDHNIETGDQWTSRECLSAIIEILNLLERSDLKSETIKELERHIKSLSKITQTHGINTQSLEFVLDDLNESLETLRSHSNQLTQSLKENEFLAGVRQRLAIPGGSCNFDLPALHSWLALPFPQRQTYLKNYLTPLLPLKQALALILHLTRKSNTPMPEIAQSGNFKKDLSGQHPYQLVRIIMKADLNLYPKISGNKHCVHVQFIAADYTGNKSKSTQENVNFELTCCAI